MAGWSDRQFDEYVAARYATLVRFAYALTGDRGHAEDLVQTGLAAAYLRWRRHAPDNLEGYLRRTLVNQNIRRFRRRRVAETLVEVMPEPARAGPPAVAGVEERDAVRRMLGGLSPRQRTVIALRYFADLTEAQTADLMGVTVGTVKSLASRALHRMRTDLAATEGVTR